MTHAAGPARIDRLYDLLPAVHRLQDAKQAESLRALLQVMATQLNLIEDDIENLYENWFIETCADWVVPYLGDLVGWRAVEAGSRGATRDALLSRVIAPRRDVANLIRSRRRKGTLALLEQLATDVAGWPSRAVEYTRLMLVTPALEHPSTWDRKTVSVREADALDELGGPFETTSRTPEVRRIQATPSGRYNVPSVALHVFRLGAYAINRAPACCLEEVGPHWYTFSALGNDAPLFARPSASRDPSHISDPSNVPHPIGRRALRRSLARTDPAWSYYGVAEDGVTGQSFAIWADDWPRKGADHGAPIGAERIIVADLSNFQYTPPRDHIAVDPVLGRIVFPSRQLPKHGVWVSFHYGFTAPLGGGAYARTDTAAEGSLFLPVQGQEQLRRALEPWLRAADEEHTSEQPKDAVIELADSGVYVLPIQVNLRAGNALQLRAAAGARPLIRLLDWQTDRPDSLLVTGGEGSRFTLDGITVSGRGLRVEGELKTLTIRHSTLVPGWTLEPDCAPRRPAEPSLELAGKHACVVIDHSIVGSIQVDTNEVELDPLLIRIRDSVVDATGSDCDRPECEAIGGPGSIRAHARLEVARSTIIGKVHVHAIALAEDSLFTGCISVARRQIGCMRFCSVTPCSRTPRRYHCQPDEAQRSALEAPKVDEHGTPIIREDAEVRALRDEAQRRVRPRFDSLRYGTPTYCRLSADCAPEITRGAEDESEMGVFHDVYQPQRLANLTARLDEFVPAAADVAILLAT